LILERVRLDRLDQRVTELAGQIAATDPGSIAAYKVLYRASQNLGLAEGLEFEAAYRAPRSGGERLPLIRHLKRS
jgi:enoyl-CoA hydratase/carnithine racemase